MADYSKEDFLQLIKRVGAFFTIKISNLFHNLDSRSVGAIAGLALAVVFTWRLLRTPRGSQRRQPKRQAPTTGSSSASNHANATLNVTSSGISNSSEDSITQNVIDEFFQPVKPTLGQIVRQRLSEGRKVTCRLLGVILVESIPEELQKQATVRSSVVEVLLEITKFCDLYLMERVLDDESEKKVLLALEDAGVFTSGGLVKDKVLFCSTEIGRTSFVRQLEPDWHVDTNPEIVTQLARFIKYQLHISPIKPEGKRYFICGTAGHCEQGMKLEIDTVAASAPPPATSLVTPSSPSPAIPSAPPTGSPVKPPVSSQPTKFSTPLPKHSHLPAPKIYPSSPPNRSPTSSPRGVSLLAPPHSSAIKVNVIAGSLLGLGF
ncbi:unnamed protein product [Fraxinus pennsylvanica]|uniref:Peroxisome biogenesis protein 22 n=1 Tax=Fraxinus pennsylvanica TaxID=56036 RepID=A0AAD2E2U2_9LAMI|nr:unnamed protein product [Fraxinus pennsylvanica]